MYITTMFYHLTKIKKVEGEKMQINIPVKTIEDTLKGKPFIGKIVEYTVGDTIGRKCGLCLMRETVEKVPGDDCYIADGSAHKYFGINPQEKLPKILDGKEVGNYCPYFTDFRAE
jgi:hypothetical protein